MNRITATTSRKDDFQLKIDEGFSPGRREDRLQTIITSQAHASGRAALLAITENGGNASGNGSAGKAAGPKAVREGAGDGEPPDDHDYLPVDRKLQEFADEKGLKYIETPKSEQQAVDSFTKEKWKERKDRRRKMKRVRGHLEAEDQKLFEFERFMESAAESAGQEGDTFSNQIVAARAQLGSLSERELVETEMYNLRTVLTTVVRQLRTGEKSYSDVQEELEFAVDRVRAGLRYQLEAREGTYRAGRITPDFLATMLGVDVDELFLNDDGSRTKIVDLGCGDGDLLIGLRYAWESIESSPEYFRRLKELLEKYTTISKIPEKIQLEIHRDLAALLRGQGKRIIGSLEIDSQLIGLDLAGGFIERLRSRKHGVAGYQVDVCAPIQQLSQKTGGKIGAETVDTAITSLTLDRVEDVDKLLANMAMMLKPGGRFMIVSKPAMNPVSDGFGGKGIRPIRYRRKSDTVITTDAVGTMKWLLAKLAQHGLVAKAVATHPYRVISTDSPMEGRGSRPQQMTVLMVTGVKDPNFEPGSPAPTQQAA